MARTYRTLSLSLPPDVYAYLNKRGAKHNKSGARIASEVVIDFVKGEMVSDKGEKVHKLHRATAFSAKAADLTIFSDEGDEPAIVVHRGRLRTLITAAVSALCGDRGVW